MLGKQYREDCQVVADAAYDYAKNLTLGDGSGSSKNIFQEGHYWPKKKTSYIPKHTHSLPIFF